MTVRLSVVYPKDWRCRGEGWILGSLKYAPPEVLLKANTEALLIEVPKEDMYACEVRVNIIKEMIEAPMTHGSRIKAVWCYMFGGTPKVSIPLSSYLRSSVNDLQRGPAGGPTAAASLYATGGNVCSPICILDVDADGETEIVFGSDDGYLYCITVGGALKWRGRTLGPVRGITVCDVDGDGKMEIFAGGQQYKSDGTKVYEINSAASYGSPVVADIDKDGEIEHVYDYGSAVYCVRAKDGTTKWTFTDIYSGEAYYGQLSAKDVDGDGKMEIFYNAKDAANNDRIFCINPDGTLRYKVNIKLWYRGYSTSCVEDFDGDGVDEVLAGVCDVCKCLRASDGALKWSSTSWYNWNYPTNRGIVVYDIDGDGVKEVVFACTDSTVGTVVCLSGSTGARKWSFGISAITRVGTHACDIDADGDMEVMVVSDDKALRIIAKDGSLERALALPYAPPYCGGITSFDADGDGVAELYFGLYTYLYRAK
jgi:outer membrane protein assembly factor BamB